MAGSADRKRTTLAALLALLLLGALVALPANAAPTKKLYRPSIQCVGSGCTTLNTDNPTVAAGSTVSYKLKLMNDTTSSQSFASAEVSVPADFTVSGSLSVDPSASQWTATLNSNPATKLCPAATCIELRSPPGSTSAGAISPGQSVTLNFTASVTCSPQATPYTWVTAVKQSNDFQGVNNDFSRPKGVNDPTVSVGSPLTGTCVNHITFATGPSNTTAGATMSQVKVLVTNPNDVPIQNDTVTLTGDIQNSGSVSALTGDGMNGSVSGVAVFNNIKVSQIPTQGATLTATESAGNTSITGNFDITGASIAWLQQPTLTRFNQPITPAVKVKVTSGATGLEGVPVTIAIGPNPPAPGVLTSQNGLTQPTDNTGVATFSDLTIGPDKSITSSGYTLVASIGSGSITSDPFAISNTDTGCTDCTAIFPGGGTVSSDTAGTTLIIENNPIVTCPTLTNPVAGTVTIIPPSGSDTVEITFDDPYAKISPILQGKTYPVCKGTGSNPAGEILQSCDAHPALPCVKSQDIKPGPLNLVTIVKITDQDPPVRH
jgi:hypothetical protein